MKLEIAVPIQNDTLTELTNTLNGKLAEYGKTDEDRLKQACEIGKLLCEFKKLGNFRGENFGKQVLKLFKMKSSWRCLVMKLHINRAKIPTVREWAEKHKLQNSTASDVDKLFLEYDKRDKTTDAPRPKLAKTVSKLSDAEKERIASLHATWADHGTPLEVAEKAELDLYRIAESQNPLLAKLLKKLKLELPAPRTDGSETEESPLARSVLPESVEHPQNEQSHDVDAFVSPSSAPSIADLETAAEPTPISEQSGGPGQREDTMKPDSHYPVFSPSVEPSIVDLEPTPPKRAPIEWKDKVTGEAISAEKEQEVLPKVYNWVEQTLQEHTISRKLAQLDVVMSPAKVKVRFMSLKKS